MKLNTKNVSIIFDCTIFEVFSINWSHWNKLEILKFPYNPSNVYFVRPAFKFWLEIIVVLECWKIEIIKNSAIIFSMKNIVGNFSSYIQNNKKTAGKILSIFRHEFNYCWLLSMSDVWFRFWNSKEDYSTNFLISSSRIKVIHSQDESCTN